MEFGWRWVTSHRHTSSLLPAAILGTLSLESPSSGNMKEKSFWGSHASKVNSTREPHFVFLFISPAYLWDVWGSWWRPWQKTTVSHNVEFLSPEPSNTSTTQPMHLSLRDHYIQNQGRKHCKSQKNKKFTVIFLSLEISEEYHEVSSTWPKQGWHQQTC